MHPQSTKLTELIGLDGLWKYLSLYYEPLIHPAQMFFVAYDHHSHGFCY